MGQCETLIVSNLTGDPLHSRALAHSRAPLFTQPCPRCSHNRASGKQWARLCLFTLQGCVQAARLCRGSPVNLLAHKGLFVHWSKGWGVLSFSERLVLNNNYFYLFRWTTRYFLTPVHRQLYNMASSRSRLWPWSYNYSIAFSIRH